MPQPPKKERCPVIGILNIKWHLALMSTLPDSRATEPASIAMLMVRPGGRRASRFSLPRSHAYGDTI